MKKLTRKELIYKNPTINADAFDLRKYNELLSMSKGLQDVRDKGKKIPYFDQLLGDIWSSFFKNKPKLLNKEEINPLFSNNYRLMERIINNQTYKKAHEYTKMNELLSVMTSIQFSEKVFEWIEEKIKENEELKKLLMNIKQQQKKFGTDSDKLLTSMQKYSNLLSKCLDGESQKFGNMLEETIQETKEIEKSMHELASGIDSSNSNSDLKKTPLEDQFKLAEYLMKNKYMREISMYAGRLKKIARAKQKSKSDTAITRSGIKNGNEIESILPSELANLFNPKLKKDFMRRFIEKETLQYANKGKESLGKGPIILCLDQSNSIMNLDKQAKGFTLALMSIAKKQRRDFFLINFSNRIQTFNYPKGKITIPQMVDLCKSFLHGGTDFRKPLEKSLQVIQCDKFKHADIIFITDGYDHCINSTFYQKFNEEKRILGFSMISLLIGDNARTEGISDISDRLYFANNFMDENSYEAFCI